MILKNETRLSNLIDISLLDDQELINRFIDLYDTDHDLAFNITFKQKSLNDWIKLYKCTDNQIDEFKIYIHEILEEKAE